MIDIFRDDETNLDSEQQTVDTLALDTELVRTKVYTFNLNSSGERIDC